MSNFESEKNNNAEKQPFISIIITCYNYGHLIHRAFNAIARQTFKDFELIFVDNGCTDNSAEIADKFAGEHPEIKMKKVIVEQNQGIANGCNKGIEAAAGKYYMFHDADDWMDDNTLEILASAAMKNDADRVISAFRDVDDNGTVQQIQTIAQKPIYWLYTMLQGNLLKSEIFERENIKLEEHMLYDSCISIKFSQYINKVAYVYEPCYNYLVHTDSTSRNKNLYKIMWTEFYSIKNFLDKIFPVYNMINTENKIWCEYIVILIYFVFIYTYLRDAPLKEKWKNYDKLRQVMLNYFPDYIHNPKISLHWKGGKRMYARIIVWVSVFLERTHLMKLGLMGYHVLSKFKYFQV